jgi:DNA-binding CsgD family transcriptional regulator
VTLIERDGAIEALVAHFDKAADGDGRLVMLSGEAGVGKTSAIERFAEMTRSRARVLVGACDPLMTPRPLGPLVDVASAVGVAVESALDDALSGTAGSVDIFRSLLAALQNPMQPTALVFEDVHWADTGTFDLLRYLGRRIAGAPAVLVATYRDDEVGPQHPLGMVLGDLAGSTAVHRQHLEPLSRRAVAELAAERGIDAAQLHRVTGGNPFFVTEVLASGAIGIPRSVRDAVLSRIARLPAATRQLAEVVAVIGTTAPLSLLSEVLPELFTEALDAVPTSGVLVAAGRTVGFRHELARMAVLESIPDFRRIGLNASVLAAMGSSNPAPDDLARLAHYAEEASDDAAALLYAHRAALHASALGAHREAAAQYGRALRHATTSSPAARATLLESQAYAFYLTDQIAEAGAAWRDAGALRSRLAHRSKEGDDLRWASYMRWLLGHNQQAWEDGKRAVRLLEAGPADIVLSRAYANLAEQACFACDLPATLDYAQRAIDIGERVGALEVVVRGRFHAALGRVLCLGDDWSELEAAWQLAQEHNLVEQVGMFGPVAAGVAVVRRDFARSDRYAKLATDYSRDYDLDMFLRFLRATNALGLVHRGRWDEAVAEAGAVLEAPLRSPITRIFAAVALALVRARRGEPGARQLLDEALSYGHPDDLVRLGPVWEARAETAWLDGDDTRAEDEARRGLMAARGRDPFAVGCVARWIRLAGATVPAVEATGPAVAELAGDWHTAATAWSELGCPYDAALARLDGDIAALTDAVDVFASLGAGPAAARTKARLRRLGVRYGTRGPRSTTRTNPHGLTSRQAEVFDLLRLGLTGPQIAARLHISPKTAEHHVAAILAKLNAHTRAEAVHNYDQ